MTNLTIAFCMYRYSKENKLPLPSEEQKYNNSIKSAEEETICAGKYHIGKNKAFACGK